MIRKVIFFSLYSIGLYLSYRRKSKENNLKYIFKFFVFMIVVTIVDIIQSILVYNVLLFNKLYPEKGTSIFGYTMSAIGIIMMFFDILAFVQIIKYAKKYKNKNEVVIK